MAKRHNLLPNEWETILITFGPSTAFILAVVIAIIFMPTDSEGIFEDTLYCYSSAEISEIELILGSPVSAALPTAETAGDAADTAM